MSEEQSVAVAEPREEKLPGRAEQPDETKPRKSPPYAVVVLNDDEHTFPYVVETFRKVFGNDSARGFQLAKKIDEEGRAIVWSGPREVAELKRDQIRSVGPDIYSVKKVSFPLGVEIEPLPE